MKHDENDEPALQMKAAALRGQVECGIKLLYSQRYDEALEVLDAALRRDGANEDALQMKVVALRLQERFQEAGVVLRDALAQRPQSARLLAQRGALFFDLQQYDKALEVLDAALRRDGANEDALQMKAAALRLQERFQEADEVLPAAPADLPLAERGDLFRSLGQYDKALNAFDEALACDPGDEHIIALKVLTLRLQERFDDSDKVLSDAMAKWPESVPLLFERSALFFELGEYDDAIQACDLVLKSDGANEDALEMKVAALRLQERFQEAGVVLRDALAQRPQSARLLAQRGALFFDLGKYDEANAAFVDVLERDRRDDFAYRLEADLLYQEGHVDQAEKLLKLGAALCASKGDLLRQLGGLYLSENQGRKALISFERAASFDPNSVFPILGKAFALRKLGLIRDAESVLAEAEAHFHECAQSFNSDRWGAHLQREPQNGKKNTQYADRISRT